LDTFKSIIRDLYPSNEQSFEEIALKLFRHQAVENQVYRTYLAYLGVEIEEVGAIRDIPFLPISFFKTQSVVSGNWSPEVIFTSSGTAGQQVSRHSVPSLSFYRKHSQGIFESFFGPLEEYHVLALLPSYLERTGSSLVAMANHFILESKSSFSGFYLNDLDRLAAHLVELKGDRKVLLLGVTFALLDLAEKYDIDLGHCMVMETGGMKGRRKEIVREELHEILCGNLNIKKVYSEYGMTELLSQAYSTGGGLFSCPPCMRVLLKEINDPFGGAIHTSGVINVIDLANAHSCAFIETQDLGRLGQDGHFEVLGRIDNSDIRGCNLMAG
jgi:hypothetical protein